MNSNTRRLLAVTGLLMTSTALAVLPLTPAQAQATRTWVSGVGDDVNPCSRTAPCKTFAGAISKTAAGGTISVLDPGGFGYLTITKSITLEGGAQTASILASGTHGIIVNAPGATVTLRNLAITSYSLPGSSCGTTAGVNVIDAAQVRLDHVSIDRMPIGVRVAPTTPADRNLDVSLNSVDVISSCRTGVLAAPGAGTTAWLSLNQARISTSGVGLDVNEGARSWVRDSAFDLNDTALSRSGNGMIHRGCGVSLFGNATDGSFTDSVCDLAPNVPPVTTPPVSTTYCTVPKVTGLPLKAARARLAKATCSTGKVKKVRKHGKKGRVFAQGVPAGIQVRVGTKVSLSVRR